MSAFDKKYYWSPAELLSYNRLFNFAIGSRGCGKSFSAKLLILNSYFKDKNEFIYLRRSEVEKDAAKEGFIKDIQKEGYFTDKKFHVVGDNLCIDDNILGYFCALSTTKYRSINYPYVKWIIFDEFISDSNVSNRRTIKDEVGAFLNLYETVDRGRDFVRVLFISNAHTLANPFFVKWGIKINDNAIFTKTGKEIITEIVNNEEFKKLKRETRFGKFIENSNEGKHIIENDFVKDNKDFINRIKNTHRNYCFTLCSGGISIGVWYYPTAGYYYCSKEINNTGLIFAFSTIDHKVNTIVLKAASGNRLVKTLCENITHGFVIFSDIHVKRIVLEALGLLF